jgi:hypothetical protein
MRPSRDTAVIGFGRQRKRRSARCFGGTPVPHIVLYASDKKRDKTSEREHFAVLRKSKPLIQHAGNSAQPLLSFDPQLIARHVGVLTTQPIGRDTERI